MARRGCRWGARQPGERGLPVEGSHTARAAGGGRGRNCLRDLTSSCSGLSFSFPTLGGGVRPTTSRPRPPTRLGYVTRGRQGTVDAGGGHIGALSSSSFPPPDAVCCDPWNCHRSPVGEPPRRQVFSSRRHISRRQLAERQIRGPLRRRRVFGRCAELGKKRAADHLWPVLLRGFALRRLRRGAPG